MSARLTRIFENDPLAAPVTPDLQAFIALAVKVTAHPEDVTPEDVRAAFAAATSPREYFDAVGVMMAFNFITRVANALGVEPEIPRWMRRIEPLRQLGLRAMGLFFRLFVNLERKEVNGPSPAEHLTALRTLFLDLRLGDLPAWVERLACAPPLLAALREFLEALVRKDAETGIFGIDVRQFMAIGQTVLQSIANAKTLNVLAFNWQPVPEEEDKEQRTEDREQNEVDAKRTALIKRFARDVALRSHTLTRERIDELRAANLTDAEILDVVVTTALWGAAARLEVLTSCLAEDRGQKTEDVEQPHADQLSERPDLSSALSPLSSQSEAAFGKLLVSTIQAEAPALTLADGDASRSTNANAC